MNIGYVENDADARMIFCERLKTDGHNCRIYEAAEELLETITPGLFDVLIVDIRLPGITGVELIKRLRSKGISVPCILITAFNSREYARDALNANANYLLEKPFRYEALISAVRQVTSGNLSLEYCVERGLTALNLTPREYEIAKLLLKGLSNTDIARLAEISEKTVKQYVTQIFQKSEVASRAEFFSSIFPV